MVSRRQAKKTHKREVLARREQLGNPVPSPPRHDGLNLVPDGYEGWILITTPTGRVKVRWLARHGIVFRDSHCWAGGRFHVQRHATTCRVEPCTVAVPDAADATTSLVMARARARILTIWRPAVAAGLAAVTHVLPGARGHDACCPECGQPAGPVVPEEKWAAAVMREGCP